MARLERHRIFEITAGILQGDTLAPFLFNICLDYIFRKSLYYTYDIGFTLIKKNSKRHNAKRSQT